MNMHMKEIPCRRDSFVAKLLSKGPGPFHKQIYWRYSNEKILSVSHGAGDGSFSDYRADLCGWCL